jgi:hypothetical protein
LALAAVSAPAAASSPEAWRKLEREVARKCAIASNFRRPEVSKMVMFDDSVAKAAVLVTGSFRRGPPLPMTNLCLFDRKTRTVSLVEAEGWSADEPQ